MALQLVDCLVATLKREGIGFCHWKSNYYLKDGLAEGRDLDLLVDRKDAQRFEHVLTSLNFKRAVEPLQVAAPGIFHFYGLDRATGVLVHLHVYYRVITGESLLKNFSFPLERLLLDNPRMVEDMPLPQVPAELMLFVIRVMLKHTSIFEYLLLRRDYQALRAELETLLVDGSAAQCRELLAAWLPSVGSGLFFKCVAALQQDASFMRRLWLATQLRRQLSMYNRFSPVQALVLRARLFLRRVVRRLWGAGKSKRFASGGSLIAFVGPEATGKSTLVRETTSWLGSVFEVQAAHLGKPPSTWLTFLPNAALPLLRSRFPEHRASRVEERRGISDDHNSSWLYYLRSLLIAWDRRALARRVRRQAVNGSIVICDRYPSSAVGAMDSARLRVSTDSAGRSRLRGFLAKLEYRLYRQVPPPDVVIRLTVPVDVAIERNKERQKEGKETDDYLVRRHRTAAVPVFPSAKTIELDSNQPQAQTVSAAREILWDVL